MKFEGKPDPLLEVYSENERLEANERAAIAEMRANSKQSEGATIFGAQGMLAIGACCAAIVACFVYLQTQPAEEPSVMDVAASEQERDFRAAAGASAQRSQLGTQEINVSDVSVASQFYVDTLGFEVVATQPEVAILEYGDARVLLKQSPSAGTGTISIFVDTGDVSQDYIFKVSDPDGNQVQFIERN
ncbi:MAG: hypothetical protein ACPGN3_06735 [Opitutales bacterium]